MPSSATIPGGMLDGVNRRNLETDNRSTHEQGMTSKIVSVDDLFNTTMRRSVTRRPFSPPAGGPIPRKLPC